MTEIAQGITFKSTPSHGYVILSSERQTAMPALLRLPYSNKYEEDVEWARVALAFPECFDDGPLESAHQTMEHFYPDIYAKYTGVECRGVK